MRRALLLATTHVAVVGACATHIAREPSLEFVSGHLRQPDEQCSSARWVDPQGEAFEICLDEGTRVVVERSDIYGVELGDYLLDGRRWYAVRLYVTADLRKRIWREIESHGLPPYAVRIDGDVTFVDAPQGAVFPEPIVAVVSDLDRAEEIARAWGTPVDRRILSELENAPVYLPSLIQLTADPSRWIGKKVIVRGFLVADVPLLLYVSSEHAAAGDLASAILVDDPSSEDDSLWTSQCIGRWVWIRAFIDRVEYRARLTRVEEVFPAPSTSPRCWPRVPEDQLN